MLSLENANEEKISEGINQILKDITKLSNILEELRKSVEEKHSGVENLIKRVSRNIDEAGKIVKEMRKEIPKEFEEKTKRLEEVLKELREDIRELRNVSHDISRGVGDNLRMLNKISEAVDKLAKNITKTIKDVIGRIEGVKDRIFFLEKRVPSQILFVELDQNDNPVKIVDPTKLRLGKTYELHYKGTMDEGRVEITGKIRQMIRGTENIILLMRRPDRNYLTCKISLEIQEINSLKRYLKSLLYVFTSISGILRIYNKDGILEGIVPLKAKNKSPLSVLTAIILSASLLTSIATGILNTLNIMRELSILITISIIGALLLAIIAKVIK